MKPDAVYRLVERFDPRHPAWESYFAFARLPDLVEVVTLDDVLCASVLAPGDPENRERAVQGLPSEAVSMWGFFGDLAWLRERAAEHETAQILRVVRDPDETTLAALEDASFVFQGFDLVDEALTSTLTNCGGFEEALPFQGANGLIRDLAVARRVRDELAAHYPDDDHARADVWAIWRFEPDRA